MPKTQSLPSYLPLPTVRVREAVSIVQAVSQAPSLAQLARQAQESQRCLGLISRVIPAPLLPVVQAGALEALDAAEYGAGALGWCLVVPHSAAAAKLRQLTPAIAAHLRSKGVNVQQVRVKIAGKY
jgi:hypothetical protein